MHHVAAAEAGVAGEHHAGLPVLRRHALVPEPGEALEPAAPDQVTVHKGLFRNIDSETQDTVSS